METNYIVVFNDKKKGEAPATALCAALQDGAVIISATGTADSVHYVLGELSQQMPADPKAEDDLQLAIDNLSPMGGKENE